MKNFRKLFGKIGLSSSPKKSLTHKEREDNVCRIKDILLKIGRQGKEELIRHLEASSFFEIGCHRHHAYPGGLAEHSLEVYDMAFKLCENVEHDSIAIAALLHDLGDIEGGQGHRSVDILERWHFELSESERRAIKYHMWKRHSSEDEEEFVIAKKDDLWRSITTADMISAGGYRCGGKILKTMISLLA